MKYLGSALVVCLLALTILVPGCAKKQKPTVATSTKPEKLSSIEQSPPPAIPPPAAMPKEKAEPPPFSAILADQLGMPVYPGVKQKDFSMGSDDKGNKVIVAALTTKDSLDKVTAFYRKWLTGYKETPKKTLNGSVFTGFRWSSGSESSLVVIESPPKGPTKIAVTVTRAPKE